MILKCELCSRKVADLEGTIRGHVICKVCWGTAHSQLRGFRVNVSDNNYSNNQAQDSQCITKVIHSKTSTESSEKPSSKTYANSSSRLRRRSEADKIRHKEINYSKPPKNNRPIQCPKAVKEIIDFWTTLGLHTAKKGTKIYNENIRQLKRALRGTLFEKHSKLDKQDIIKSIKHFHLAATDPNYAPPAGTKFKDTLRKTPLSQFIFYKYTQHSFMMEYMRKPKLVEHMENEEDKYPEITKFYVNFYVKETLGGIRPKEGFSQMDLAHFTKAARRTAEFYIEHRGKMMGLEMYGVYDPRSFASMVCDALEHSVKGEFDKLSPGWFSSDAMYHKRLPTFLFREGILEDRRGF